MNNLLELLEAVATWFTIEHVALVVSALALLVSAWATLISRRNTKAALRSAAAAEEQAAAAIAQADHASRQSSIARDTAEVDALAAAKARIDEAVPSVVVILSPMNDAPRILPRYDQIPVPHPQDDEPGERALDYRECRNDTIYFVYRGLLINDGDRAVRIHSSDAIFYSGQHPVTGVDIPRPMWSTVERCHVLEAGQSAVFELRVMKRIDVTLEQQEKRGDDGGELPFSRDTIMFLPGNLDEPRLIVSFITYANPFKDRPSSDVGTPLIMRANGHLQVVVKREPTYPQSFEHLHAELRGDEDKLRSLAFFDELRRSQHRRERQDGTN